MELLVTEEWAFYVFTCYRQNGAELCTFKFNLFVLGLISHEVWNWTLCYGIGTDDAPKALDLTS